MKPEKIELFATKFRDILSENAGKLLDFRLHLMETERAEGWRIFYAREILLAELLPPPLINALGRQYEEELLREEIWRKPGQRDSTYRSAFLEQFLTQPATRADYRNYLNVGTLDTDISPNGDPFDRTANDVVVRRMESETAHFWFELSALVDDWYIEATSRATLTPPLSIWEPEPQPPVRTDGIPLVKDGKYWKAVHSKRRRLSIDAAYRTTYTKPDWCLKLMSELAPDFPYSETLSTTKRLVFLQHGEDQLAWALMIDKTDGSPDYRFPPKLILVDRGQKKKLKDEHIVFDNVVTKRFPSRATGPRCIETELHFHLPRSRRLIGFYAPCLAEALAAVI